MRTAAYQTGFVENMQRIKCFEFNSVYYLFRQTVDVIIFEIVFVMCALDSSSGLRSSSRRRRRCGCTREPLQVGVVDGEVCVVLLQDPDGRPLDGELADAVAAGLTVRGADNLDVVSGSKKGKIYNEIKKCAQKMLFIVVIERRQVISKQRRMAGRNRGSLEDTGGSLTSPKHT